jgi:hypothetical protein
VRIGVHLLSKDCWGCTEEVRKAFEPSVRGSQKNSRKRDFYDCSTRGPEKLVLSLCEEGQNELYHRLCEGVRTDADPFLVCEEISKASVCLLGGEHGVVRAFLARYKASFDASLSNTL